MTGNNKELLSRLKAYQNLEKLIKIQEDLSSNKIIQEAKLKQSGSKSNTSVNPII